MQRSRIVAGALVGAGLVLAGLSVDGDVPAVRNPVRAQMTRAVSDVYGRAFRGAAVPGRAAEAELLRTGLTGFFAVLPLEPAVRQRLEARVASDAMREELVPFAWFLKSLYDQRQSGIRAFDPPTPAPAVGGGVPQTGLTSAAGIARLLTLYDAIWLAGAPAGAPLEQTLRCGGDEVDLRARTAAAAPLVRSLLGELGLEGEAGAAIARLRDDDALLRTVSTSLVEFLDAEVCKHHAVFTQRAARKEALYTFLDVGLERSDPAVWEWVAWADHRPRAVHVIVDGLQGGLTSALVAGDAPWFADVLAAHDVARPDQASTVAAPPMALGALRAYAAGESPPPFPTFSAAYEGTGVARAGLSTTPTISVRNLPVVMTGAPVAGPDSTGIPNFHFVDRTFVHPSTGARGRPYYFYGNDALQLTRLTRESGMRTMFERLAHLETMSCGSQYDERAGYSFDGFLNLAIGEKVRDFGDGLCVAELERRAAVETELRALRAELAAYRPILVVRHRPWEIYDRWVQLLGLREARVLASQIAEKSVDGLPDYLQYYNPWPDHFAHAVGPYADAILGPTGEYARLDHWLGQITAAYDDVASDTLFGMAGDHGLTPVLWVVSPEAEVFDALRREGVALAVAKISSDEGEGPKLTDRFDPPPMTGFDLVVASTAGGNYMIDAFTDQGAGWAAQPLVAGLRRWRTLGGRELDLLDEVTRRLGESLDYAVARVTPCGPAACTVQLLRYRAGSPQQMTIAREGDQIRVSGDDLLGVDLSCAEGCSEAEWRRRTAVSGRPDAVVQLAHLYDTDRAGTVNLFPVLGVGYNTGVPGRHAGESFAEKDAFVGLWGAPVHRESRPDVAVNGQIAPTLFAWLTGETPRAGEDGWGFEPLGW